MSDFTGKQLKEFGRIKNAGDYKNIAEVKRAVAAIGIEVLLNKYGMKPLLVDE